jgi:hypothetical protein
LVGSSYTSASQLAAAIKAKKLSPREALSFLSAAQKTKSLPQYQLESKLLGGVTPTLM